MSSGMKEASRGGNKSGQGVLKALLSDSWPGANLVHGDSVLPLPLRFLPSLLLGVSTEDMVGLCVGSQSKCVEF